MSSGYASQYRPEKAQTVRRASSSVVAFSAPTRLSTSVAVGLMNHAPSCCSVMIPRLAASPTTGRPSMVVGAPNGSPLPHIFSASGGSSVKYSPSGYSNVTVVQSPSWTHVVVPPSPSSQVIV